MRTTLILAALIIGAAIVVSTVPELREAIATRAGFASEHSSEAEGGHSKAKHGEGGHHAKHKIVVTTPITKEVRLTEDYVCQIHSRRHIELKAIEEGYLQPINVNEGQAVKQGEIIFQVVPTLYKARLDADVAEAEYAKVEYDNAARLVNLEMVSEQELKMARAKVEKALAKVNLSRAELAFASIKAPFNGIIGQFDLQEGSMVEAGEMLTTMSDNSLMWVYFNMSEAGYYAYQRATKNGRDPETLEIELELADHTIFDQPGKLGAIESDFNNETGNIAFRADFPNPDFLLRNGQTGTILIHQTMKDAIVIPQRAVFPILAKKYVYVVDEDCVVHQREIHIHHEAEDIYVIDRGVEPGEKIVFEGILQVRDGETIECDFRSPEEVHDNLKYHAE